MIRTFISLGIAAVMASPLLPQNTTAIARPAMMPGNVKPVFEVATIKQSNVGETLSIRVSGRRFITANTSLIDLITFAYGVHAGQVTGGPPWANEAKYDVVAEPDIDSRPNNQQLRSMVQKLLADRWKLGLHHEMRELSVYTITAGKAPPKLTRTVSDPNGSAGVGFRPTGELTVKDATIAEFASFLQRYVVDRPVVDKSGIPGKYDIALKWAPDEYQFGGNAKVGQSRDAWDLPDLFTAIQQQLGLRMQSGRSLVDTIVIDHVQKPTDN